MNKPFTMVVKETKKKIADICNESGLSPIILDLIMHGVYSEVHSLAERQTIEEEAVYNRMMEEEASKNTDIANSDVNAKE